MSISNYLLTILIIFLGPIHISVEGASLRCYDGSFNVYTEYSLDEPQQYLNSSLFDFNTKTVFYVAGFKHTATGDSIQSIVETCLSLSLNVCLLNWEKEASGGGLNEIISYPIAVAEAIRVGRKFSQTIKKLVDAGLGMDQITFIGFSLGASLMGFSGNEYERETGTKYSRIIGCDPAGPFFDGIISLPSLDALDADFVMSMHTNPKRLGTDEKKSTMDVSANCGNPVQPGCETAGGGLGIRTPENMCSHNLSWKLLSEGWLMPDTLIVRPATSCDVWQNQGGGNTTASVVFNIDTSLRGQFFFATNNSPPYGRGESGSNPN